MNINRAEEIVKSLGYIDVVYEGKSVWIEELYREEETALIKPIDNKISIQVPLSILEENKSIL